MGLEGLDEAELLEAAWAVLEAVAERRDPRPIARRALARLGKGRGLDEASVERLATEWLDEEGPLALVREGGATAPGWFTVEEARELVTAAGKDTRLSRGVWRYLVRRGWTPADARLAAWGWSPASGTLPNGQWIPPELLGPHPVSPGAAEHPRPDEEGGADVSEGEPEARREASAARAAVDEAIRGLMLDHPFHWALLDAAHVVEDRGVATMAVGVTVDGGIALFYSPSFVGGLSLERRMGVLLHEVHHVIFDHLKPAPDPMGTAAWILACEVTANEWVPYDLPHPITIQELNLPPMESTLTRYARLLRRKKLPSEWSARLRGVERDRILRPLAAEPRSHEHYAAGPRSAAQALEAAAARASAALDPRTRRMLSVPALATPELADLAIIRLGGQALAWDELLRVLARGFFVRTRTRAYPSRRLPELLGIAPGRRARRRSPVVMAVVDTSASMSTGELAQVSAELTRLVSAHVRVACLQCDDAIRTREWLAPGRPLTRVHGRGGTDLRPPLSHAELRKVRPDLVVYFTDGHGPAPAAAPPNVEVLWVLTGSAPRVPAPFGRVVLMRRHQRPAPANRGAGHAGSRSASSGFRE